MAKKLKLKIDGSDFTGLLCNTPVIKDQLNACCRTLEFNLALNGQRQTLLAHKVELYYGSDRWFIGEVKKQKENEDGTNAIKVYDPLFLFSRHEDDYYFKNQTATKIIQTMAGKAGVRVYSLAKTKVVLGYLLYKKGAPDKIAVDALARTWKSGGDKFWIRYNAIHNGIQLAKRTVPSKIWVFKTGNNILSATRERTIEDMYNTVKLINRETGKTVTKVNAKNKALYGNTQYYEEISDKNTNLSKYATNKLASLSKIKSTINMSGINADGNMGQFYVGDPLYVEEKNTGTVGGYWITNVTQTFLANDCIQLEFDLTATEDIPAVQYDNDRIKICVGKTTKAVHCRKSARSSAKSLGIFPKGTEIQIEGKDSTNKNWYKVTGKIKKKSVEGYTHKGYVKIIGGTVPKS